MDAAVAVSWLQRTECCPGAHGGTGSRPASPSRDESDDKPSESDDDDDALEFESESEEEPIADLASDEDPADEEPASDESDEELASAEELAMPAVSSPPSVFFLQKKKYCAFPRSKNTCRPHFI
jgi:cobalamin biosynthesis protein CobT